MSAHLERQRDHYSKLAKKFGLATLKELSARPLRYRWDLIERDINKLLSRPRHLPVAYTGAISGLLFGGKSAPATGIGTSDWSAIRCQPVWREGRK